MTTWRKGNHFALVVGMQTGATPVERSMEITKKIKNGTAFWPSDPSSGTISKGTQNTVSKDMSSLMFIAALFTIAKIWKRPKCPSIDQWRIQPWDLYTMGYYSAIKKIEENVTLCNCMDGPGEHYANWNKVNEWKPVPSQQYLN